MSQETENGFITTISRRIEFPSTIEIAQKERLLDIASKCPVSKILTNQVIIHTTAK